ncbi:hypothetical protein A2U01_0085804, partial [Trifolium medium]|nr:hypothetical protein [Trifolium medium]
KWLRGGMNTAAAGRNDTIGNATPNNTRASMHSMFGRVKVVYGQKTKKMDFFMGKAVNESELRWVPLILNQQDKQDEGSTRNAREQ